MPPSGTGLREEGQLYAFAPGRGRQAGIDPDRRRLISSIPAVLALATESAHAYSPARAQSQAHARTQAQAQMQTQAQAGGSTSGQGTGATPDPAPIRRAIPSSGETLAVVGLGTWITFDAGDDRARRAALAEVLSAFVARGGQVIDSSPMYGSSERVVGDLAAAAGLRSRLFVATKVWTQGRAAGIAQMAESARLLRSPVLDLMQIHNLLDWKTHLETLRGQKREGRCRHIGVTHYHAGAYDEVVSVLRAEPLDFLQINYSLLEREAQTRVLPVARERGVAVIVNRPFAEGELFRRVRGRALPDWAGEIGCRSWAQLALKWILAHPAVTCTIPGSGKVEHLVDNMSAGHGPMPDDAMRRRIERAFDG